MGRTAWARPTSEASPNYTLNFEKSSWSRGRDFEGEVLSHRLSHCVCTVGVGLRAESEYIY